MSVDMDRAQGALLGLAVGDALGVPLIGLTREQAQIKHATVTAFLGGGLYLLPPGGVTARVDMARAAALALTRPSEGARLDAYQRVFDLGRPGLGETTRAALGRASEGASPPDAARAAHAATAQKSAGVGPALRAVPYALAIEDDDALAREVLADAALTHQDPRAGAAALALAWLVKAFVEGADDRVAVVAAVRERLAALPELPDVLPAPAVVASLPVQPTAFAPDVLHAVVKHGTASRTAEEAIVGAVNHAGAASALGAATGAVVGARFGARSLPARWTDLVHGAAAWRTLAERLVARRTPSA